MPSVRQRRWMGMAKNKTYIRLIHSNRWLQLRKEVLTMHPICQECERLGRISPAKEVHHIVPVEKARSVEDMSALMYDIHNLMALCTTCHIKIHNEMGKNSKEERVKNKANALERVRQKFFDGL